ncbi:MAG: isoleucine--tRNA ligase [Deltaproteobacteria bacterium CG2_30_63_29]|nr:MAG: isoleucine--tRNA ligase [Deltaproteobacteria bacterium CG2_30_63_29]PIW01450.1 MAG: isoleucine--tRNA ligase [Deltaproteobacteria bacterium CG17_big_fil_post_rev_8_21_14_2_50_63_7]PJB44545.1 MAG: isoleucine--tRNA ligase [Deltaproteobacteria bacterium CG_4_9_14_3_um_filter_63_12]
MSEAKKSYSKVETWIDVCALEHEILDFWKETDAFATLRKKNAGNTPFSFLDGPITANNPMGVHHAWGRTLKDAFQRYHAMNGKDLRYQNGFDCQGLWVEVEVEKEHGFKSKRDIIDYGIDRFVEDCKARVRKYSAVQTHQSVRLGMWMDWENSYFTMSDENNYTIWGFLKKCHDRKLIKRGFDVMPWSGRSGTAYSQMEVIEGRKLVAHKALFVKFPLRERKGENLVVWTTTPWTLTSNVAAAVNVDLDYVKLRSKQDGELYYLANDNLNFQRLERQFKEKKEWLEGVAKLKTLAQLFNERGGYTLEGTVKGAELLGLTYDGPFDELEAQSIAGGFPFTNEDLDLSAKQAHRVIDGGRDNHGGAIVVAGEGTGIVHTAPGCGDVDHIMGKALGLPMLAPLDGAACFLEGFGPLTGRSATDHETTDWIIENLREKGVLIAVEQYPHMYPHCWRSGDELVFRMVDEWYIDMSWRDEIIKVVDDIRWLPGYGREREIEWLTNMHDWMISKKRFWGLALPIWTCEACETYEVLGSKEELKARAIEGWEAFDGHSPHRPWIDAVKIACPHCGGVSTRVEDVGNPWLDAGIVPYSTTGYNQDRDKWKHWMPADLVLECFPGQFRNWFYSLLALSTMMEGIAPFKTLVGHALVRDETGKEMHKSTGNAIWFDAAADEAGADIMRWLYVRQDPIVNLNFGYGPLREVRGKFINTLWNTYAFFVNYARTADWTYDAQNATPFGERTPFDQWIVSELQGTIETCRASIEDFNLRIAAGAIEDFVENLSNWYVRHNRRRYWKTDADDTSSAAAFETLYECLFGVIRLAAPMIPFLTEKMYQGLVRAVDETAPVSVHHCDYPVASEALVDAELREQMRAVMRMTSLALSARDSQKLKVRQPLAKLTVGPNDAVEKAGAERFREMLLDDLNVKTVEILEPGTKSPLSYELKANFKSLGPRFGKQMKAVAALIGQQAEALIEQLRRGATELPVELDGVQVVLTTEDLIMAAQSENGAAVAEEKGTWVSFDTQLTDSLLREGVMRDLLRRLQMLRKESGFEIEDRIALSWDSEDDLVVAVFEEFGDTMARELLASSVGRVQGLGGEPIELGEVSVVVGVAKA